jgi:hypothetical protein
MSVDVLAIKSLNHAVHNIMSIPTLNFWIWMRLNLTITESNEGIFPLWVWSDLFNEHRSSKHENEEDNCLVNSHT